MNRREFLISTGTALGCGAAGGFALASSDNPQIHNLKLQAAKFRLRQNVTSGMVSLSPDEPPPILYAKQGEPVSFNVTNGLDEYTAMHWHGIRLPNAMDGVPYLTQFPIAGQETYAYQFTPPDAGTYWYHPHCMTMTQMARGLTGVLVIREPEDPGFDSERIINLRDFRLAEDDSFLPPYTLKNAARGGTLGNVLTANWLIEPVYEHQAGSLVRLRLANTDTTRLYGIFLDGADGKIIALDGHPVDEKMQTPAPKRPIALGPGQRADVAVQMPKNEGAEISIVAFRRNGNTTMAKLRSIGTDAKRSLAELKPLPRNPIAVPDMGNAQTHEFVFGWSPGGEKPRDGFCGSMGATFWSINRTPWPGDAATDAGPLANLDLGKTYILRLRNESPNYHPVHLHGLVFLPLKSNKRKLQQNWTDTVIIFKDEIIDVALVADNPGDWAFHCHLIEHQKTGLAGYIRVS
ncbi:MAG: multicopper oxidase family protein [Pseudomonadota bacterium]